MKYKVQPLVIWLLSLLLLCFFLIFSSTVSSYSAFLFTFNFSLSFSFIFIITIIFINYIPLDLADGKTPYRRRWPFQKELRRANLMLAQPVFLEVSLLQRSILSLSWTLLLSLFSDCLNNCTYYCWVWGSRGPLWHPGSGVNGYFLPLSRLPIFGQQPDKNAPLPLLNFLVEKSVPQHSTHVSLKLLAWKLYILWFITKL